MRKYCFSPGCTTGGQQDRIERKKNGEKIVALFRAPRDQALFEKWKAAIPVAKRELSQKDCICAMHFHDDDVIRHFEVKHLPGGKTWKEKRDKPILRKGAVPCFFPNLPADLSIPAKKEKLSKPLSHHEKEIVADTVNDVPDTLNSSEDRLQSCERICPYLFKNLKKDLLTFDKVSWSTCERKDSVAVLNWKNGFSIERWIVIFVNMTVKVFLKGVLTTIGNDILIACFEDVVNLINRIDDLVICSEANSQNTKCRGFLKGDELKTMYKCEGCNPEKSAKQQSTEKPTSLLELKNLCLTAE